MAIPPITPTDADSSAAMQDRIPIQRLGQDEFLKILVTQMTSQDPLNPQKDTEFIAQMAQFSALENSKAMQEEMTALRSRQDFLQANSLLGREVELATGGDTRILGTVDGVKMESGEPLLVIDDESYPLASVLRVWQQGQAPGPAFTPSTETPHHAE